MLSNEIRQFVVEALADMSYDVEDLEELHHLGPAGVDLESLALAELAVRIEEKYKVQFDEDESERMALMTVGMDFVTGRLASGAIGRAQ